MANPNPDTSGLQPFKPGQSGNPGGKTSEHRKAEIRAAEIAANSRLKLVESFAALIDGKDTAEDRAALLSSDWIKILKDSEDRAFGTASQHVDQTSSDGSARLPHRILLVGPDEE